MTLTVSNSTPKIPLSEMKPENQAQEGKTSTGTKVTRINPDKITPGSRIAKGTSAIGLGIIGVIAAIFAAIIGVFSVLEISTGVGIGIGALGLGIAALLGLATHKTMKKAGSILHSAKPN